MKLRLLGTLTTAAFLSLGLCACPPTGDDDDDDALDITDLIPGDNEVGSWALEGEQELARDEQEVWDYVDGDADPFTERDMVAFARQSYSDGTNTLELRIWEMPDAAKCTEVYEWLETDDPLYSGNTWTAMSGVGEAARETDTGADWWINARKGVFEVETRVAPNTAGNDALNKTFMEAVVAKIK